MTSADIAAQPTRQAIEAKTRSAPGRVTGKLRDAIHLMITEGKPYNEAGKQVGLTARTMRLALERPHVLAYLKRQREVFRQHASAANIHRLAEIRDAANNMPAVQAIKVLEELGEDSASRNRSGSNAQLPGFVIQIINAPGTQQPVTIEHKPAQE